MHPCSSALSSESLIHSHNTHVYLPSHLQVQRSQSQRSDHSSIARNHRARSKSFRREQRRLHRESSAHRPLNIDSQPHASGTQPPSSPFSRFGFLLGSRSAFGLTSSGRGVDRSRTLSIAVSPKTLIPTSKSSRKGIKHAITLEQQLENAIAISKAASRKHRLKAPKPLSYHPINLRPQMIGFTPSKARSHALTTHLSSSTVTLLPSSFAPGPDHAVSATVSLLNTQVKHFPSTTLPTNGIHSKARLESSSTSSTTSTSASSSSSSTYFPNLSDRSISAGLRHFHSYSRNGAARVRIFVDGYWQRLSIKRQESVLSTGTGRSDKSIGVTGDGNIAEAPSIWSWFRTWSPV